MLLPTHAHEPRAGHADEQHVDLVVLVLLDTTSRVEAHQIGVEVIASLERPDYPRAKGGIRQELPKVHRDPWDHAPSVDTLRRQTASPRASTVCFTPASHARRVSGPASTLASAVVKRTRPSRTTSEMGPGAACSSSRSPLFITSN